jgi:small subunit ribosomal protein S20
LLPRSSLAFPGKPTISLLTDRASEGYKRGFQEHFRIEQMANHKSAKTRIRRNARRADINGARISRVRTFMRKVESAIGAGDKDAAQAAFRAAQPEIHRGVGKGVLNKNMASRKLSRLSARIKALS